MKSAAWVLLKDLCFGKDWKNLADIITCSYKKYYSGHSWKWREGTNSDRKVVVRPEGSRWEVMVPEPELGNMNEKNQESFRKIWDVNLPRLVVKYSWCKKEERDENILPETSIMWVLKLNAKLTSDTVLKPSREASFRLSARSSFT